MQLLRKFISALLIVLCFLLQCTVFRGLAFSGIVPNLMIILTASFGFMRGEKTGLIFGVICGLLADIFFGELLGLSALIYMYIGYLNGKFNRIFYPEDIKLPLILIIGSDLVYCFASYIILFMLRGRFQIGFYFSSVILPEVVYTTLVTLLLYPFILWINNLLEKFEKRSERKFV